jgi:Predicted RNA-binding protein (contains KH domain)
MTDLSLMLSDLVKAIVDSPDKVTVETKESEDGITLTLRVAEEDMGMVIGKHGKIAKAIRTIVKSAAKTDETKVVVEIK